MATYASGSVRVPGLSGNDADFVDMIKKLREVESRQINQLGRWKKDWETRLNAFKELRTELMNMQTALRKLSSLNTFYAKSAVSSNDKIVTAVADADALNSSYSIEIKQKATSSTWTKDTGLYDKKDVVNPTAKGTFSYSYKGKIRTVEVSQGTTIEGLVKLVNNDVNNPGVRAQLIQTVNGISFQLQGKDTGQASPLYIRDTTNLLGLDVSLTPGNYDQSTESRIVHLTEYASSAEVINNTGADQTFMFTVDGTRRVVTVKNGDTLQDLVGNINAFFPSLSKGLATLQANPSTGGVNLVLERPDTTFSVVETYGADYSFDDILKNFNFTDANKPMFPSMGLAKTLEFNINNSDDGTDDLIRIEINENMTAVDLGNALQKAFGDRGKVALEMDAANVWRFTFAPKPQTHQVMVNNGTLADFSYVPPTDAGWDVHHGQNAMVKINGYPADPAAWMEFSSNTIKAGEAVPGVTFYLQSTGDVPGGTGKAEISVSTDTAKIEENIVAVVDAVNAFRSKLLELTEYDETKQTLDLEFAESIFEMQKGGVLQGNYGVQMIASRLKNAIGASAIGFTKVVKAADGSIISGDLFSALAEIGITTNATQGETNYGLLEINRIDNYKGSKSLTQALAEDPEAVARLFALKDEGVSHSDKIHYNSHLPGITKPGTYSVAYEIDSAGQIASATINGMPADIDNTNFTIASTNKDGSRGLLLTIADRTPNLVVTDASVSIQTGKINELLDMLDGTEGMLGSNGAFRNLEKNYQNIIDGIDNKIEKENDRITRWENMMVQKFARLEQVLARYAGIQKSLESQIKQLGGNSSGS